MASYKASVTSYICSVCDLQYQTFVEATNCQANHEAQQFYAHNQFSELSADATPLQVVSASLETFEDQVKTKLLWTDEAMQEMLRLVELHYSKLSDKTTKHITIWRLIQKDLEQYLPGLTADQVFSKWRNLNRAVKKYEDSRKQTGASGRLKEPPFLKEILKIRGEDHSLHPVALKSSLAFGPVSALQSTTKSSKPHTSGNEVIMAGALTSWSSPSFVCGEIKSTTSGHFTKPFCGMMHGAPASKRRCPSPALAPLEPPRGSEHFRPGLSINLGGKTASSLAPAASTSSTGAYDVGGIHRLLETLPIDPLLLTEEEEIRDAEEGEKPVAARGREMPRIRPRRRLDVLASRLDILTQTYTKICEIEAQKLACMRERNDIQREMLTLLKSKGNN